MIYNLSKARPKSEENCLFPFKETVHYGFHLKYCQKGEWLIISMKGIVSEMRVTDDFCTKDSVKK
jgi:hypothetical protein